MSIFFIISLLLLALSIVLGVILYKTKKRAEDHTRENFAFKSVALLISTASTLISMLLTKNSLLDIISELITPPRTDNDTYIILDSTKEMLSYILAAVVFLILVCYIFYVYKHWNGAVSARQYKMNKYEGIDSNIMLDFIVFSASIFRHNNDIKRYLAYLKFDNNDSDYYNEEEKPWHIEFAELYYLLTNQIRVDTKKDWHSNHSCFVTDLPDEKKMAIYCTIDDPSKEMLEVFLTYIDSLNMSYTKIVIATKNGDTNLVKQLNKQTIEFISKDYILDNLVNFDEYYRSMSDLYHQPLLVNEPQKIDDIYVAPFCTIDNLCGEDVLLDEYVQEWLSSSENNQLALLGDYGMGKTLFSIKLTFDLIMAKSERVPIFIPLRGKSPRNSSPNEILSYFASMHGINPISLLKLNSYGRLLLIFDGFDEMDMIGNSDIRRLHFRSLWGLATRKSKIILTGRPNYFLSMEELQSILGTKQENRSVCYCKPVYLSPFNNDQIIQALRSSKENVRRSIIATLRENPNSTFIDLISRPSHLFFVNSIWEKRNLSNKFVSLTSATVMNEFVLHCFERQSDKMSKSTLCYLTSIEKEFFMTGIALKMFSLNTTFLNAYLLTDTINELIDIFPDNLSKYNSPFYNIRNGKTLKAFISNDSNSYEAIMSDIRTAGLLVFDIGNDGFTFSHKSFFDVLIAKHMLYSYVKEYNEYDIIYNALSNVFRQKIQTKNHAIIKLLAEFLATNIKSKKTTTNVTFSYSIRLFREIYRAVTKKRGILFPRFWLKHHLKHFDSEDSIYATREYRVRVIDNRKPLILRSFILVSLITVLFFLPIIFAVKSIATYSNDAKRMFNILEGTFSNYQIYSNPNATAPSAITYIVNNFSSYSFYFFAVAFLVFFRIFTANTSAKVKPTLVLLTWYYLCREIGIDVDNVSVGFSSVNLSAYYSIYGKSNDDAKVLNNRNAKKGSFLRTVKNWIGSD